MTLAGKPPPRAATPMAFVRAMLVAYGKYGVDPAQALREAGIGARDLRREDACITALQMEIFSGHAMRELDDEALGWFRRRLPWGSYGLLCRASVTSPNLGVALKRWCRHHGALVDDVELSLRVGADRADIVIEEIEPIDLRLREFCLLTLLRYVHGYACWAIDSRIAVRSVSFAHAAPPHASAYGLMFPGPVHFGAPSTCLSFDSQYLALPLRRDELALRSMLTRALVLTVLPYRRDRLLVQRVRERVLAHASAESLADSLHMSKRTLHRHLREEGTSLQALRNLARRDLAIDLLLRTSRSIKQIAGQASFASEKSFARAFQQWTGLSPSAYRRQHQGEAARGGHRQHPLRAA
ncbi:MAG TPA: AraC family transcriptional regulator [Rubrivivax sp.]|nr:AraC family transcriptional regulator [Rubrivivax sp.]